MHRTHKALPQPSAEPPELRTARLLLRPLGNTIYVMPPYCISPQQVDQIFDAIEAAAKQFGG